MTKLQKEIVAEIARNGVAVFNTSKRTQIVRTARVMMTQGFTYYWTGTHLAIARYGVCAKAAVTFANHRCMIKRFLGEFEGSWYQGYLLRDKTFCGPSISEMDRMPYADVVKAERERKANPVDPTIPVMGYVHPNGYMLNTKTSTLTAIPVEVGRTLRQPIKKW